MQKNLNKMWYAIQSALFFWYSAIPEKQQVNDSHHLAGQNNKYS